MTEEELQKLKADLKKEILTSRELENQIKTTILTLFKALIDVFKTPFIPLLT